MIKRLFRFGVTTKFHEWHCQCRVGIGQSGSPLQHLAKFLSSFEISPLTVVKITQHVKRPVVIRIQILRHAICSHRLLGLPQRFIRTCQAQLRINTSGLKLFDSPVFLQRLQILTAGFADLAPTRAGL